MNRRLLVASACNFGLCAYYGVSVATVVASVAGVVVAVLTTRPPADPTLTVQDRCLMNQERLAPTTPGAGTMAIVMYIAKENLPSVDAAIKGMRHACTKFPRFGSVVVETRNLEDTYWRRVEVDMARHVVEHAPVQQGALEERINGLINTDLPRDVPLWRIDLLPTTAAGASSGCVLLRASHALGDGLRLVGAAGEFLSFADGAPASLDLLAKMAKAKLSPPPRGVGGLAKDLVTAMTLKDIRDEDKTCLHAPGELFPRATPRVNVVSTVKLADLKAIRAAAIHDAGSDAAAATTTLNDVILGCFVGGLRAYAELVGEPICGEPLVRALIAVSMPSAAGAASRGEMFNDFLLPSVTLPIGATSRAARLSAIRQVMAETKASRAGYIMGRMLTLIAKLGLDFLVGDTQNQACAVPPHTLPRELIAMPPSSSPARPHQQARIAACLQVFGKHAFVYSNLPGFTQPVHLFERTAKVDRFAAYFPNLVSQLLFLSYGSELTCSLSTDAATITRPQAFVDCFALEVAQWAEECSRS